MKQWIFLLFILPFFVNLNDSESAGSGRLLSGWIGLHLQLIQANPEVRYDASSRHFSYISKGFYEAVAPAAPGQHPPAGSPLPPSALLPDVSGNAAYAAMLRYFYGFNKNTGLIDSFENTRLRALSAGRPGNQVKASVDYGKAIAKAIIVRVEMDRPGTVHTDDRSKSSLPARFQEGSPGEDGYWLRLLVQNIEQNDLSLIQGAEAFVQMAVSRYDGSANEDGKTEKNRRSIAFKQ